MGSISGLWFLIVVGVGLAAERETFHLVGTQRLACEKCLLNKGKRKLCPGLHGFLKLYRR